MNKAIVSVPLILAAAFSLGACNQKSGEAAPASTTAPASAPAAVQWPASLVVVGTGFPKPGDPCRVIGENALTNDYLGDSSILVGCLTAANAAKIGGEVVATIDGVTLVSVPDTK
jgi:hypothetical protein